MNSQLQESSIDTDGALGGDGAFAQARNNAMNDPIFAFIWKYRTPLTVILGVIVLAVLYMRFSEQALQAANQESARVLSELRQEIDRNDALREEQEKLLAQQAGTGSAENDEAPLSPDALEKKLLEAKEAITKSDTIIENKVHVLKQSQGSYVAIGDAYAVGTLVRAGALEEAVQQVENFSPVEESAAIYQEQARLRVARALLDDQALRAKGVEMLKSLVQEATIVHASAAKTLRRIATTAEERQEAIALLEQLIAKQPALAEGLREDIASLR